MIDIPGPFDITTRAFNVGGLSVTLAMPVQHSIPWQTVQCLTETVIELKDRGIPFDVGMVTGCSIVEMARNKAAHQFLAGKTNRLFWVDSDIVWTAKDFIRLLALSTKMSVVCAAYPAKSEPISFLMNRNGTPERVESNEWGCLPIGGLGLGFCCVNRDVMADLAQRAPKVTFHQDPEPQPRIFRSDILNGGFRGEDIAFFDDLREAGVQCWLDPRVELGHVGSKVYSGSILAAMQRVK